ncbi:DUF6036 family nucleotidyltransferase [Mycolicibacterium bacteremicum]|uniref:DUF6036 family nucleotidyltransferase n=1 Tax=Mycolicibacterium bacteremicum TaxID=564198 RepID=UPI0026EC1ED3|nr:DUF6036 family nucleotidyltransferase [Mycolicibacterium bacteremicum]
MRADQLALGIAEACRVLREPYVVVFGSQSILGSFSESELPAEVTRSREMDVSPWRELVGSASREEIADAINTVNYQLGEESAFDYQHGFYIEAISRDMVLLPDGWDNRLVHFTADISDQLYGIKGLCLEPNDLCVAKALAGREHDRVFVAELIKAELVDPEVILSRLQGTILWPSDYIHDKELAVHRAVEHVRYVIDRSI